MAALALIAPLDGWIVPLEAVQDPVFAERMMGDGIAIDPTGDCLHAPCAGRVAAVQPTGHAVTLTAENGIELLIHLGLDTVALAGRGLEPLVRAGDQVAAGDPLIRFDLDLLVREVRAVVTPLIVVGGGRLQAGTAASGRIAVGEPLLTVMPDGAATGVADASPADERRRMLRIVLPHGIHARPAARIAQLARERGAGLRIAKDGREAAADSPTGLLTLGVRHGDTVTLIAAGPTAEAALDALETLIAGGMGETAGPPAASPPLPTAPRVELPAGALAGVTAAGGLAVGRLRRHHAIEVAVVERGAGIAAEEAALHAALAAVGTALAAEAGTPQARVIAEAHRALLDDPALVAAARANIARGKSAGHAWRTAIRPQAEALRASGDARLAERADDMIDLERRVIAQLAGAEAGPATYPAGTILVAANLLPSELMALDLTVLVGLCVEQGGPTSHVAILAAAAGLPMLVAMGAPLATVTEGAEAILDADAGLLHVSPSSARVAETETRLAGIAAARAAALARAGEPCRTADGTRIELFANLGSAAEAAPAVANGAEGCGLLRTEFLFLERATMPDIAEQTVEYQAVADGLAGRPLIVRLLDIGGDKPASYLPIAAEENPALGLRGIRVGLAHPAVLEAQLRAILGVRPLGQCRIMVPMVAGLDELRAVRAMLDRLREELGLLGQPIELGVMVETPAAAITADLLAREANFLSIGTNDLTQYTLAMDRGNQAVAGALDGLHPAVLRLIGETCRGGTMHGRWTGVCGGLASDPLAVPLLVGLGVTELSAAPAAVLDMKTLVGRLDLAACRGHAARALACADAGEVRVLARTFERELRA